MLNKKDFIDRIKRNPEPKEVTEMREHILDSFKNLEFIEDGHKYYLHNEDGSIDEPISVSTLVKEFEPYINWELKAQQKADKLGVDISIIKRQWEENQLLGTNPGTIHHAFGQQLMNLIIDPNSEIMDCMKIQYEKGYLIPSAPKQEAIMKYWEDIIKIDEIYPLISEVKMYMPKNNKFGINKLYCGTADITFAIKHKGEWCILLHDYKNNKTLINDFARNAKQMMLPPFEELVDEPMSHYTFQLSAYSLMLMNLGYKVIDRKLIWIKNNGEYEKIQLEDITQKIINFYQN